MRGIFLAMLMSLNAYGTCQQCQVQEADFHLPNRDLPLIDKGVIGHTFNISEEDLLKVIEVKLRKWEGEGKLSSMTQKIQQKAKLSMERPTPVKDLHKATTKRRFTYDPTFVVEEDIRDHEGRLIHPKGKRINPLHLVEWGDPLIFIDGDDTAQVASVLSHPGKIVLVRGSSLQVSKMLDREVFFDQGGTLSQKLKLVRVPAYVFQEGYHLVIEERPVDSFDMNSRFSERFGISESSRTSVRSGSSPLLSKFAKSSETSL